MTYLKDEDGNAYNSDSIKPLLEDSPLWFHKAGLQQTQSGYGKKLATPYMVRFGGRLRRLYCACFSDLGTCYIIINGVNHYIET